MEYLYLIFNACLKLRFRDMEIIPDPGVLFLLSAEYSEVMCGAWQGTIVT